MATKHFFGGRVILGTEYAGYKFAFFEPGTSTPKTTYKDSSLTAGNENTATVTLDANGAAQIWFDGNADVTFYTSADVVVYTDDDINLTTSSSTSGSGNFITNASFETDSDADGIPDGWTRTLYTAGTFTLDTTDQYNGQKSAKFVSVGTGGGYLTSTDTFAVSPTTVYTVGFAIKSTADVRNVVEVLWYQDDGTASGVTSSTTVYDDSATNPTSWTQKWYEATSPSDAAFAKIRLTGCHSSDATSGTARFDNVIFTDLFNKAATNTVTGIINMSGKAINLAKGTSIAAAGTTNIYLSDGNLRHLTGTSTTTISSFGTATQAGAIQLLISDGNSILAQGTNMNLNAGGANIALSTNDLIIAIPDTQIQHNVFVFKKNGGLFCKHEVSLYGNNGHGSTNTKIRRFSSTRLNTGTSITYADSAANGASFTINDTGVYAISYTDTYSAGASTFGASLNISGADFTTNFDSISKTKVLCLSGNTTGFDANASGSYNLTAGDIVYAHGSGVEDATNLVFSITRIS